MKNFNLAVIAGDGIGPEVVTEGLRVLDTVAKKYDLNFSKTNYELGAAYWHKTGETLPDSVMADLAKSDVILLGAVGDPSVPSGVLERGLLLKLRFAFEHYINLRPAKLFPGVSSPITNNKGIDFVVVREGTEGLYVGAGSIKDEGTNKELAIEESINTYKGVERVIRDAFNRAQSRPRKKVTLVHKNNVLTRAGGLWSRVFNEVSKDFSDVTTDYLHVDAASMFFVTNPERFDVVVTDNLFGDIITDIAAAICGGIGLAASGNINPTGAFPSMFEPVHGSAPDIAGKNQADPTATVLSVAMMLNHLGQTQAAKDVENAVAQDLLNRGDKKRSTTEIGDALVRGVA
ncbi:MAG: 3-isopropylmalate dehydrogenase [Actinobacteria bacterium]|jgi:3-isopropylmalate dehydrogenase|nr:3-isopropylmalate dehydrogenase [Actinomycetota bacterium]